VRDSRVPRGGAWVASELGYSSPISPRQARFSIRQKVASSGVTRRDGRTRAVFAHQTSPRFDRSPSAGRPSARPRRTPRVSSR
jgi:hypothetical protein